MSCSKLTRESGTDFPIPPVGGGVDGETEKLIREKDEEVQNTALRTDTQQHHEPEPQAQCPSDQREPPEAGPDQGLNPQQTENDIAL